MDLFNMVYSKKLIWLELIGKYERWPEDRLLDVQSTKPELKSGWLIKNGSDLSYLMKLYWDNIKKELQWPTEYLTFAAKSGDSCSCGCFYSPKSWGTHFSKAHHVPLTMNNNELKREAELFKESKSYFLSSLTIVCLMQEPSFPELESLLTLMETSVSCAVKCYRSSELKGTVHDTTAGITSGKVRKWLSFLRKIHKKQWLLPPATKLGQGNIFRSVCQEFCPQAGGGCAWQGGMRGRYYEIRSMSGRYASYWNAFLFYFWKFV